MKTTEQIRWELKRLIRHKKSLCTTIDEKNKAVNDARMEINAKYGKNWRERDLTTVSMIGGQPSIYDDHEHGEHWMD